MPRTSAAQALNASQLKEPCRRFLLEVWIVAGCLVMLAALGYALFSRIPREIFFQRIRLCLGILNNCHVSHHAALASPLSYIV